MAGIANAPLEISAFRTVGFFTKLRDSVFGRRELKSIKERPSVQTGGLLDWHFRIIYHAEARAMILSSSEAPLSDEMVDILACLVNDGR
jgi:hypothetical protein